METFFYNDNFFSDLGEFMDYYGISEDELNDHEIPDEKFSFTVNKTLLCKAPYTSLESFRNSVEHMVWEDFDAYVDGHDPDKNIQSVKQVVDALIESLDFEKFVSLCPDYYLPTSEKIKITRVELKEYCDSTKPEENHGN